MEITTIIPCFNVNEELHNLTGLAVDSINKASKTEMIIIDNASTFGAGYLRDVADIYVRNKNNVGYPGAVNQGLALGSGDVFCISNNDIRVPENIFKVGLDILKDKEIGSVHFKMIAYDNPFGFVDKLWITGKERWCTSSFFLIRREALPDGNYDLNFGLGSYDDYDFWNRVRHINGWKTAYTCRSAYQHWGSRTFDEIDRTSVDDKNLKYFIKKYGKHPDKMFQELYPEQWKIPYVEGFE